MTQPSASAATLRARAEAISAGMPALLAEAEHLARTVMLGDHGRRRSGQGDEFWQFRPAVPGDSGRAIDWRRSARGDQAFVREREWQAAQSVVLWLDSAAAMRFTGAPDRPEKGARARLLGLALACVLLRGGERVGLADGLVPPRAGRAQIDRLALALAAQGEEAAGSDYGTPPDGGLPAHGVAVFVSDFLGPLAPTEHAVAAAADAGLRGTLLQILDPAEEAFPFDGRTVFESMTGTLRHETLKARDLRERYRQRLDERRGQIAELCARCGWTFGVHHTGETPLSALLWLYRSLEMRRG